MFARVPWPGSFIECSGNSSAQEPCSPTTAQTSEPAAAGAVRVPRPLLGPRVRVHAVHPPLAVHGHAPGNCKIIADLGSVIFGIELIIYSRSQDMLCLLIQDLATPSHAQSGQVGPHGEAANTANSTTREAQINQSLDYSQRSSMPLDEVEVVQKVENANLGPKWDKVATRSLFYKSQGGLLTSCVS